MADGGWVVSGTTDNIYASARHLLTELATEFLANPIFSRELELLDRKLQRQGEQKRKGER
jgi:hypothetical protein